MTTAITKATAPAMPTAMGQTEGTKLAITKTTTITVKTTI